MAQTLALGTVETPKAPVSSAYHGITVTEDYRWLDDAASDRTRSWTVAQDRRTRSYLGNLPSYGAVRRRAVERTVDAPRRPPPPGSSTVTSPTRAAARPTCR